VRVTGARETPWLAVEEAPGWPCLRIVRAPDQAEPGWTSVETGEYEATVPTALPEDELVHPLLGGLAAMVARAVGRDALHGGAVVGTTGAWAVLGDKGTGKSTLLAACAKRGLEVLTDDVLVLDGEWGYAGPRCIDLRPEAGERFGPGVPVRGGTRLRLTLPPARPRERLAGFLHLRAADTPELVPLSPSGQVSRLLDCRTRDGWPRDPQLLLELGALPAYDLTRAADWEGLEGVVNALVELVGISGTPRPDPTRPALLS
jgi:hypothetical protein